MLRASVMKSGDNWVGVHRNEKDKIVWSCGHLHANRDASTKQSGMSALDCAMGCTAERLPEVIRLREEAVALLKGSYRP